MTSHNLALVIAPNIIRPVSWGCPRLSTMYYFRVRLVPLGADNLPPLSLRTQKRKS